MTVNSAPDVTLSQGVTTQVANLAQQLTNQSGPTATLRIGTITNVDSTIGGGYKVQCDITGSAWLPRDEGQFLHVGDRVYLLQQGAVFVVVGRLQGNPAPTIPVGGIIMYAGGAVPPGFMYCDGSAISRTDYAELFNNVTSTFYGAGDGSTTFNLPDMRGRVPLGYTFTLTHFLGATGGSETVVLSAANLPAHDHGSAGAHTHVLQGFLSANEAVLTGSGTVLTAGTPGFTTTSSGAHTHSSVGSGSPTSIMQPFQVVNYIIRVV